METKKKPYGDEFTDFCDKETPKVGSEHTCLVVISLSSGLKEDENYYPQIINRIIILYTFKIYIYIHI